MTQRAYISSIDRKLASKPWPTCDMPEKSQMCHHFQVYINIPILTLRFGDDPKGLHLKHTQKGIKIVYRLVSHGLPVTIFDLHSDQWHWCLHTVRKPFSG